MRILTLLQTACAVCLSVAPALSQDISGKWYGTLDTYSVSDPRRVLSITQKANQTICTWDEIGRSIDAPAQCTLRSGVLDLVTAARNNVRLVSSASNLVGTFTLTRNRGTFQISMNRTPDFEVPRLMSTRICDQAVEYMPGVSPSDAPEEIRGFLGKWQGTVSHSAVLEWCAGFVFQGAKRSNALSAKYAWSTGSGSGLYNVNNLGVTNWSGGRVKDGALHLPGNYHSFELRLVGPDKISGFFSQGGGRYPISLSRL